MASLGLVQTDSLHKSPVPFNGKNVRVVENRIVIDAHHTIVFNFVINWANLPKWLPVAASTSVRKGKEDVPAELGDVLWEGLRESGRPPKEYTVVARIPGVLWVVTGTDEGDSWIRWVAHFSTTPLEGGKTLYCRVFQQIVQDGSEPVRGVTDSAVIQPGLEKLKEAIEKSG